MGSQVKFFEKNYIDYDNPNSIITVVDAITSNNGQEVVDFLRSRKNTNAWVTGGGSLDATNTALEITMGGAYLVSDILLVGHNFSDYELFYDDNDVWVSIIDVTGNIKTTNHHNFTEVLTSKIKVTIKGTLIADSNKSMKQLIITKPFKSGQLEGWTEIKATLDQNKKVSEMLSGKVNIKQSLGGFTIDLDIKASTSNNDLEIFEEMYERAYSPFLIWCNAGNDTQFHSNRKFFRAEDIFLVKPVDNYVAQWFQNIYTAGMPIKTRLKEVIR